MEQLAILAWGQGRVFVSSEVGGRGCTAQLKGKIEIFSLDALVNMATSAGMRVGLNIRPITSVRVRNATAHKAPQTAKRRLRA